MSAITIGIQVIMPKTGTSPEQTPPPQSPSKRTSDSDNAALVADAVAKQAPPPPGMGKLVDKTV
jgi:hypothetical protein